MSHSQTAASAAASGALPSASYTGPRPHSGGNLDLDHVISTSGGSRPSSPVSHRDHSTGEPTSSLVGDRDNDYESIQNTLSSPQRSSTLKKKSSLRRTTSLGRASSRRSSYAGSVRSLRQGEHDKYDDSAVNPNSAFVTPIPTSGSPTELLADRFQAWRKVLKDLINYFRDLQKAAEVRHKNLQPSTNLINATNMPPQFLAHGGLGDAIGALQEYHKQAVAETSKARELENEVILQLTGLRSDLQQKIKEIKSLSGDFKNSVDREQENTKKVHRALQESLGLVDQDAATTSGKGDPFLIKLSVDRQIERQIEEENYLHRAYLNLEASGRELESIVVGEIQKAYNVLAGILNREATNAFESAAKLREGPLALKKDYEWDCFTKTSKQMVDPDVPLRNAAHIVYPGQDHPAALEVRSGMLERKSKYLKNYTPGWYILSPTHLHEFKSADRIVHQSPVMSLYLPEQKLGAHSDPGSSSHKFMLKGRQSGSMHRGHSWVFRAETHDTMLAWYNDIKELTERKGEARNEFVRRSHARSLSGNSLRAASINSSEGDLAEDEADKAPFSSEHSLRAPASGPDGIVAAKDLTDAEDLRSEAGWRPQQPRGRFPSDVNMTRNQQLSISPSSGAGSEPDAVVAAAAAAPAAAAALPRSDPFQSTETPLQSTAAPYQSTAAPYQSTATPHPYSSAQDVDRSAVPALYSSQVSPTPVSHVHSARPQIVQQNHPGSTYGEWMTPLELTAAAGGAAIGAEAVHHHHEAAREQVGQLPPLQQQQQQQQQQGQEASHYPPLAAADSSYSQHQVGTDAAAIVTASDHENHERSLSRQRGLTESTQGTTNFAPSTTGAATISTDTTAPTEYSVSTDETERIRPEKIQTSQSIQTLSDLLIPGRFPKTAANEEATATAIATAAQ